MDQNWLIYGANGFTGRLIAERAKEQGRRPILAGRNEVAVADLAGRLGLEHRAFPLDEGALARGLDGVSLVLHCAGPYSATSAPMLEACLAAKAHYLDITGEVDVIEHALSQDGRAREAGVVVMPAVGFDVVPTDCVALRLKEELPSAVHLELAFTGGMKPSPGTAKTTVEGLGKAGTVRRDGALQQLAVAPTRSITFGDGRTTSAMAIPWGDLASAFRSTGIGNITVYTQVPAAMARWSRFTGPVTRMLSGPRAQRFLKRQVEARVTGASDAERASSKMWVWGRVSNDAGESVQAHLQVPEGYTLTVTSALEITRRIRSGEVPDGARTPAMAFGSAFAETLDGVGPMRVER